MNIYYSKKHNIFLSGSPDTFQEYLLNYFNFKMVSKINYYIDFDLCEFENYELDYFFENLLFLSNISKTFKLLKLKMFEGVKNWKKDLKEFKDNKIVYCSLFDNDYYFNSERWQYGINVRTMDKRKSGRFDYFAIKDKDYKKLRRKISKITKENKVIDFYDPISLSEFNDMTEKIKDIIIPLFEDKTLNVDNLSKLTIDKINKQFLTINKIYKDWYNAVELTKIYSKMMGTELNSIEYCTNSYYENRLNGKTLNIENFKFNPIVKLMD